jgi:hypothetical protein
MTNLDLIELLELLDWPTRHFARKTNLDHHYVRDMLQAKRRSPEELAAPLSYWLDTLRRHPLPAYDPATRALTV